jgi:hypothetical protein
VAADDEVLFFHLCDFLLDFEISRTNKNGGM